MSEMIHDDYPIFDALFYALSHHRTEDLAWRSATDHCDEEVHVAFLGPFDAEWFKQVEGAENDDAVLEALLDLEEPHRAWLAGAQAAIVSHGQVHEDVTFYSTREAAADAWNRLAGMKGWEPRALPNDAQGDAEQWRGVLLPLTADQATVLFRTLEGLRGSGGTLGDIYSRLAALKVVVGLVLMGGG